MVEAWFMDDDTSSDQRLPHRQTPNAPVSLDYLASFGVKYYCIDGDTEEGKAALERVARDLAIKNRDQVHITEAMPNYADRIKVFFQEHLHEDDEVRHFVAGSGYFDVRDPQDRWIRIHAARTDLLVLPAGIYHRFTLDTSNSATVTRLFADVPKSTPINRPADDNAARVAYVSSVGRAKGGSA
eukprot:Opistho-1_new@60015